MESEKENMENEVIEENAEKTPVKKTSKKLEKHILEKIKGRVIIINAEESEFAKNLNIKEKGDYNQKK
ncbi:MAG TPA: hypothetical protein VI815_04080 [Candidatus Nanoarchaeia archaeon]|nr:hypothetical protein [Candidatus Nanoarchaeia archaeon]